MRRLSQFLIATLALLLMAGAAVEAVLRVGLPAPQASQPVVEESPMYRLDASLGARPKPGYPGHDARGWRNDLALETADIVALGDSHTYGIGADHDNSWPAKLADLSAKSVYQMAFGGYSPVHFLRLRNEIFALRPKIVIVGLYFGANFTSSYLNAYIHQPEPLIQSLRSDDPDILRRTELAHRIDGNWWIRASYLDCQAPRRAPSDDYLRVRDILASPPLGLPTSSILDNSLAYREIDARVKRRRAEMLPPPFCVHYSEPPIAAILSPSYRLINLEITDPRNVEGERVTIQALRELGQMAIAHEARLIVVLLPTKELAFEDRLDAFPETGIAHLERLWEMEEAARGRMASTLAPDIEVIDALPAIRELLARDIDPYQTGSADGHPSAIGYAVIAKTIADRLDDE